MKLEDIGFYTLSDKRAKHSSEKSDLSRCELILTDRCNFKCPYCRGVKNEYHGDLPLHLAANVVRAWVSRGLKNIRFSGGEPTLYKGLPMLISMAKKSCKHIALSTNGSAPFDQYEQLIDAGVNDFSISLDACCADTMHKMSGGIDKFSQITDNILKLSKKTYTTVGIVLTHDNSHEVEAIIKLAVSLHVKDIRVIPAAQWKYSLDPFDVEQDVLDKYPILKYRYNNLKNGQSVRGLSENDNHRCPLVLDDMAVIGRHHYPCIIYLREQGNPLGQMSAGMDGVRKTRARWAKSHDVYADDICRNNCLDVCRDFNNKWKRYHE
jgi:MoaA/NifB/PqqE/SkfB family radical SAM enzyme